MPPHIFREIQRFFEEYKVLEDKEVVVNKVEGSKRALEVVIESLELYRREEQKLRGWGG